MILKYKVPKEYYNMFNNKKIIYCKILQVIECNNMKMFLVKMLNFNNFTNIFLSNELRKLNIIDKINCKLYEV